MCGIIGYVGGRPCQELIVQGLERLEYRGYDSAGFRACWTTRGRIRARSRGRQPEQAARRRARASNGASAATTGLGHTRWATHGRVTEANAHPHLSGDGRVAVVMNGIIENYMELRRELQDAGVVFHSETDTEVLPHLIARAYQGDLVEAVRAVIPKISGHYAFVVAHADEPGRLVGTRYECPLVVGVGETEVVSGLRDPGVPARDARDHEPRRRRDRGARRRRRARAGRGRDVPADRVGRARRVGRGRRREGRLRHLHAQGDPRAAGGAVGHHRRPPARRTGRS